MERLLEDGHSKLLGEPGGISSLFSLLLAFPQSLRAFRGRQPLCGTGVLSVMEITSSPPKAKPWMAACKGKREINPSAHGMLSHVLLKRGF